MKKIIIVEDCLQCPKWGRDCEPSLKLSTEARMIFNESTAFILKDCPLEDLPEKRSVQETEELARAVVAENTRIKEAEEAREDYYKALKSFSKKKDGFTFNTIGIDKQSMVISRILDDCNDVVRIYCKSLDSGVMAESDANMSLRQLTYGDKKVFIIIADEPDPESYVYKRLIEAVNVKVMIDSDNVFANSGREHFVDNDNHYFITGDKRMFYMGVEPREDGRPNALCDFNHKKTTKTLTNIFDELFDDGLGKGLIL